MSSFKTSLLITILFAIVLSGCADDSAMHLTGEEYLHKEPAKEREAQIGEPSEGLANLGKYTKKHNMSNAIKGSLTDFENSTGDIGSSTGGSDDIFQQSGYLYFPIPEGKFTSNFGWRNLGGSEFHSGMDLSVPQGTPLIASLSGTLVQAGFGPTGSCGSSGGCTATIQGKIGNKEIQVSYLHLSSVSVKDGDTVKAGQQIGLTGNTGRSTGPHLHVEVSIKDTYLPVGNTRLLVSTMFSPAIVSGMKTQWWWRLPHLWSRVDPRPFFKETEGKSPASQTIKRAEDSGQGSVAKEVSSS